MPEPENKHQMNKQEKEHLKKQYNELIELYDDTYPLDDPMLEDLAFHFNCMQALISMNVNYQEVIRRMLIKKNIATKQEINDMMDKVHKRSVVKLKERFG